jgi:polysaccharide biosynthesis/export protein
MKRLSSIAALLLLVLAISSCGSTKNLQYMQGSFDTSKFATYSIPEPVIQKGDLLSILVFSDRPDATALYNQSVISSQPGASTNSTGTAAVGLPTVTAPGYLVDNNGNIQFQGIGQLHIEGLNKEQLIDLLNKKIKDTLLFNPYYNIRFLNFKITLIGDVARPGVYSIPSEQINLLEALGLAGDLNITARRDNVRIIREQNGKRQFGTIDLRSPEILRSPFYQLHQNDVIYVDFNKSKAAGSDLTTTRNISLAATVVSTLAILYSIFRK